MALTNVKIKREEGEERAARPTEEKEWTNIKQSNEQKKRNVLIFTNLFFTNKINATAKSL